MRFSTLALLLLVGCSSNGASPRPDAGAADDGGAGTDAGGDDAAAADSGDASGDAGGPKRPAAPQVLDVGGPVIAHPKIVPVSFPNDPLSADIDTLYAAFASTTYWGEVTAEYGIAPAKPLPPVHVTTPAAATIDDTEIQQWLASQLDGTHPEWPAPDADTLYVLNYPPGTTITLFGETSCVGFHGYHSQASVGANQVSYSVVSRCASVPEVNVTGIQYVSAVASHEVIEALTDPLPFSKPAYETPDDDHLAWALALGGELGDMCALNGEVFFQPADFPYTVQRIWSNAAAKAGNDPCVPAFTGGAPYVEAVPAVTDKVAFDYQGSIGTTKGVRVPLGKTGSVDLDLFSADPSQGPFHVAAIEVGTSTPNLTLTLDKDSGNSGDTLHLSIAAHSQKHNYGGELVIVRATLGTRKTYDYLYVGN